MGLVKRVSGVKTIWMSRGEQRSEWSNVDIKVDGEGCD